MGFRQNNGIEIEKIRQPLNKLAYVLDLANTLKGTDMKSILKQRNNEDYTANNSRCCTTLGRESSRMAP
jgi:hypothetical protein